MPTVGLWRLQLAPAVDATKQELWIASDKEQTSVRRADAPSPSEFLSLTKPDNRPSSS